MTKHVGHGGHLNVTSSLDTIALGIAALRCGQGGYVFVWLEFTEFISKELSLIQLKPEAASTTRVPTVSRLHPMGHTV